MNIGTSGEDTNVNITHRRLPDVGSNLPVYPDARQIEQIEGDGTYDRVSLGIVDRVWAHIITKTYLTGASLDDIEHYYNLTLPNYAWYFYDRQTITGNQWVDKQTGSLASEDGLFFVGDGINPALNQLGRSDLFITASSAEKGHTRIQLRAFTPISNPPDTR